MSTGIIEIRPFGELAEFRNGLNFAAESRGNGELGVIGVGDFQKNERLGDYSRLERIARPDSLKDDTLLRNGDLLFVRSNGNKALIGRCMKLENVAGAVTHSGFTIRARLTTREVDPEWVAQYFSIGLAKRAIARGGGGTNISNLSQKILQELPIPIPEANFQERVLSVAGHLSDALEQINQLIAAKRTLKRGLMQQLLTGQKRFPEFRNRPWQDSRIGDLVIVRDERAPVSDEMPLFSLTIEDGITPKTDRYDRTALVSDNAAKKYKVVQPMDIVFNPANLRWGAIGISRQIEAVLVSPIYEVLEADCDLVDPNFLFQLLSSPRQIAFFASRCEGTLVERMAVKLTAFVKMDLRIPIDIDEQRRIAEVLTLFDQEIALLAAQRQHVERYKRSLLSHLLRGDLKVSEVQ